MPYYDPLEHYAMVKNKWFGLRPPPLRPPPTSNQFGSQRWAANLSLSAPTRGLAPLAKMPAGDAMSLFHTK